MSALWKPTTSDEPPRTVFARDSAGIRLADSLLVLVKGENANLGVEAGFACVVNRTIIILVSEIHRLPGMWSGMDADGLRGVKYCRPRRIIQG